MTMFEIVVFPRRVRGIGSPVRIALLLALIAMLALVAGCATLTGEGTQSIAVVAVDAKDAPVGGMHCAVTHAGGVEAFKSPAATLSVQRSSAPLEIECTQGELIARGTAVPRGDNALAHTFIPGGYLGTVVDHLSGRMYSYPTPLRLRIGEHLRFEHGEAATATHVAAVGAPPPATQAAPRVTVPTVAVTASTPISATRATRPPTKPTRPVDTAARPPATGDTFDARDLQLQNAGKR